MAGSGLDFRIDMSFDKLKTRLKDIATMNDVKQVVKLNTAELTEKMIGNAEFMGHWKGKKFVPPTRATKKSIVALIKDDGLTGEVGPHTSYAPYLEWGTRFMSPQMFAYPAYAIQKELFLADIKRLMK